MTSFLSVLLVQPVVERFTSELSSTGLWRLSSWHVTARGRGYLVVHTVVGVFYGIEG